MRKKVVVSCLAMAMVTGVLAGCGAKTNTSVGENSTEGTSGTAQNSTNTQDSSETLTTYEKIMKDGKITVATEAAYAPYEYIDEETGEIVGYDEDILKYICDDWGVELEQMDLPFQGILTGLDAGQYDMVATAITITQERADAYAFTQPLAMDGTIAIKLKGNDKVKTDSDGNLVMDGLVVGSQQGSGSMSALQAYNDQVLENGGSGYASLNEYSSFPEAYLDLQNGRIDVVFHGRSSGLLQVKESPDTFEVAAQIGDPVYFAWACRKGDEDLVEALNVTIQKMIDDGTMEKIQEKWIGETAELPGADYVPNK